MITKHNGTKKSNGMIMIYIRYSSSAMCKCLKVTHRGPVISSNASCEYLVCSTPAPLSLHTSTSYAAREQAVQSAFAGAGLQSMSDIHACPVVCNGLYAIVQLAVCGYSYSYQPYILNACKYIPTHHCCYKCHKQLNHCTIQLASCVVIDSHIQLCQIVYRFTTNSI